MNKSNNSLRTIAWLSLLLLVALGVAVIQPRAWAAPLPQDAIHRGNQTIPIPFVYLPVMANAPAPLNISNNFAMDERPVWSPDGTKIAFFSNRGDAWMLYTMNANGGNVQMLPHALTTELAKQLIFANDPRWSPDGTKIAYVLVRSIAVTPRGPFLAESRLLVNGTDGTGASELAIFTGESTITFDWSPDSTRLVYGGVGESLIIVNADGSNPVEVATLGEGNVAGMPDWSPDGNRIVFGGFFADGIYIANADGSALQRIVPDSLTSGNFKEARWSPEGARLVMRLKADSVQTTDPAGGDLRQLDETSWDYLSLPVWSPYGDYLAFFGAPLDDTLLPPLPTYLYVTRRDLGVAVKVAPNAFGTRGVNPSWSPDGKKIVYSFFWNGSNSEIFVIELGPLSGNSGSLAPARQLGVIVDESLHIMDVEPNGSADLAGLQVGDLLIDLTLLEGPTIHEAIPFTDRGAVKSLIASGDAVKLRYERSGQMQEITLQTIPPAPRPGMPTPTPVFPPDDYF